jgi:hypothetical protein
MRVNIPRHHLLPCQLEHLQDQQQLPTHSLLHTCTTQLMQLSFYHNLAWNLLNLISIVRLEDNKIICKEKKKLQN